MKDNQNGMYSTLFVVQTFFCYFTHTQTSKIFIRRHNTTIYPINEIYTERERLGERTYNDKTRSSIHSNVEDITDNTDEHLFNSKVLDCEESNQNNRCHSNNLTHQKQRNVPLHIHIQTHINIIFIIMIRNQD